MAQLQEAFRANWKAQKNWLHSSHNWKTIAILAMGSRAARAHVTPQSWRSLDDRVAARRMLIAEARRR